MDTQEPQQPQHNTFVNMHKETALSIVNEINELDAKIRHARKPEQKSRYFNRTTELLAQLHDSDVVTDRRAGMCVLAPTEAETAAAKVKMVEWYTDQQVRDLARKKSDILRRIDAAIEDLHDLKATYESGRTDAWQLTSSNWAEITKLSHEIKQMTETLTKLGVLEGL